VEVKKFAMAAFSLGMLTSTGVTYAQAKTRAQVYQEFIEAKQNGLGYVTDASYPEVATVNEDTVAWLKKQAQAQAKAKAVHDNKVATAGTPGTTN
jgi:Domain of unknown function (DUF4148)